MTFSGAPNPLPAANPIPDANAEAVADADEEAIADKDEEVVIDADEEEQSGGFFWGLGGLLNSGAINKPGATGKYFGQAAAR